MKMMLGFLKALQKRSSCKNLLKKLIKQCYEIIFEEGRYTYLCAERTLGVCLLMYFDFDSTNLNKCSLSDLEDLFEPKESMKTEKYLNKLMEKLVSFQKSTYCLEYVIVPRRVAVSVNLAFFQMIMVCVFVVDREVDTEMNVYDFEEDGSYTIKSSKKSKDYSMVHKVLDETSADNKRLVKKCKQFVERESYSMMLSQVDFKSTLKKLDGNAAKITNLFSGILLAFEGDTHETILASYLGFKGAREKILEFYRELTVIYKDQTIQRFKAICESWISNEEVFEHFMKTEYDKVKNKESK